MEAVVIPSPSVLLGSPLLVRTRTSHTAMKTTTKRPPPKMNNISPINRSASGSGTAKPKQSKSRNGCVTCKAKRLKCDETKPSCQQCHKRGVQCGGYKKDFKWRPFGEASFVNKTPSKAKKAPSSVSISKFKDEDVASLSSPAVSGTSLSTNDQDTTSFQTGFYSQAPTSQVAPLFHSPAQASPFQHHSFGSVPIQGEVVIFNPTPYRQLPSHQAREEPRPHLGSYQPGSIPSTSAMFVDSSPMRPKPLPPSSSGQPPKLIDLLAPVTDFNTPPVDYRPNYQLPVQREMLPTPPAAMDDEDDDFDEEIIRQPQPQGTPEQWALQLPSPSPSASSNSSSDSPPTKARAFAPLFDYPQLPVNSPEMLMMRFDKQTCGILSIKDGPSENPWRTLIWPLARESPALYHAVSSMTAFHLSRERTSLRVDGMEHMRKSIRTLAAGLEDMRTDAALATTLALAFSESWDQHISTGIEHLRGARILVNRALVKHKERSMSVKDYARLRFLFNTFVYMDVIARLTSDDDDESNNFETVIPQYYGPFGEETEVDPLMGCAATLFPLIGYVANLARRVRKSKITTVLMIEQGMELKTWIENWKPGSNFDPPEDPTSGIQHCIRTAEAYRWATLLYLHQALPEIPSPTTAQLANKVLVYLATVPIQSRTVIIHIFPLLVAGCEAVGRERDWVRKRWEAMIQRLCIGNVDKCWDVTKEVWRRRDEYQMERALAHSPMSDDTFRSKSNSPMQQAKWKYAPQEEGKGSNNPFQWQQDLRDTSPEKRATSEERGSPETYKEKTMVIDTYAEEDMDYDLTVRGRLHWAGVMQEWDWEVLLG